MPVGVSDEPNTPSPLADGHRCLRLASAWAPVPLGGRGMRAAGERRPCTPRPASAPHRWARAHAQVASALPWTDVATQDLRRVPAAGRDPDRPGARWRIRASLPEPNSEMSVASLDGFVYVVAGYPSSRVSVTTVQVYDPTHDRWSVTTPLPRALNHTVSAAVGGILYVIGGQPDAGGGAAVVGDRIYVAGGRPPRGHDFAVYTPATDTWAVLPDLPTQRNHLGMVAVGADLYVIGGRFGAGFESEQTAVVERDDTQTGRWALSESLPLPRGGVNAVAAYGCIHVFGGEGSSHTDTGVHPDHDVFDPFLNRWYRLPPMPVPVHGVTGGAFLGRDIYLPGGGTLIGGASGSSVHQAYRPYLRCQARTTG